MSQQRSRFDGKWGREIKAAESDDDKQRELRRLLYALTPVEMFRVVLEVIERQEENAKLGRKATQ